MSFFPTSSRTQVAGASRSTAGMWTAAWMVTAVFMLSNSPTPLYVHWQEQMGFSSGMLTVIFALYIAGLLGTLLVAGQLSDRYGRKPVLLPGLLAALAACGLFATATSIGMLAVGRLLAGVAVGVIVSAGMAAVIDAGGAEHKRRAALLASIAMVLGAGLGPLLAGGLSQALAQPVVPAFVTEALVLLTALAVALRWSARSEKAAGPLRLRLPHVPVANRRQVLCGIATFGPGITATSFVLALGPSLLARLLDVRSPLLAGAGQGLGQLGGLTLIGLHVPDSHRAQSNAVLNIGGYIPAGLLPVATGYLIDAVGLASGATLFALVLAIVALVGGIWAVRRAE